MKHSIFKPTWLSTCLVSCHTDGGLLQTCDVPGLVTKKNHVWFISDVK